MGPGPLVSPAQVLAGGGGATVRRGGSIGNVCTSTCISFSSMGLQLRCLGDSSPPMVICVPGGHGTSLWRTTAGGARSNARHARSCAAQRRASAALPNPTLACAAAAAAAAERRRQSGRSSGSDDRRLSSDDNDVVV